MTSPNVKVEIYFKEFSFLKNFIDPIFYDILKIGVSRVDVELLNRCPYIFKSYSFSFKEWYGEKIYLLDKEGEIIYQVGVNPDVKVKWYQNEEFLRVWPNNYKKKKRCFLETVGEALTGLGDKIKDVYYILSVTGSEVVICKPPKTFTLKQWVDELYLAEENELKESLAEIDETTENTK